MDWQRLRNLATPQRTLAAFALAVGYSVWFFMGPYARMGDHGTIVDVRFGSGPGDIVDVVAGLSATGRDAYRSLLVADLLFPLLHAAWMAGFVAIATRRWQALPDRAVALPLLALVFDWIENLSIFALLAQHPDPSPGVAAVTMVAMHAKLLFHVSTGLVMVAFVGWLVMNPVKRGPKPRPVRTEAPATGSRRRR